LKYHYCHQCHHYCPLRSRHCRVSKQCVLTFDHHCFWIGGVVSNANTSGFVLLLFLAVVLCFLHWKNLVFNPEMPSMISSKTKIFLVLLALLPFTAFTCGLLLYHCY
ncbi:unnamed protein product, partial [Amoebophrya sp. A120]